MLPALPAHWERQEHQCCVHAVCCVCGRLFSDKLEDEDDVNGEELN